MKTKEAIKYVGLMVSQNTVRRGESLNVMVMLENTCDEAVSHSVKLFIQDGDNSNWRLCSNKEYNLLPHEHLHAYLNISRESMMNIKEDEFLIFAGDVPPESDTQLHGVSDIVLLEGIPFDVKLPAGKSVEMDSLSEAELNQELEKGHSDFIQGKTKPAAQVFSEIRKDYGL